MRVVIPLPDTDFDTTEVAVPWRVLTDAGVDVEFATERGGTPAQCDPLLLTGVVLGQLGAEPEPKAFYADLLQDEAFRSPTSWRGLDITAYDGLLLPGGHAPGMRQYLGSTDLQRQVAAYWGTGKPVGAICHGPLVLARAQDGSGRSVLHGRRTTALPKHLERTAFLATAWRRGRYYRTYPQYVQDEVTRAGATFVHGPRTTTRGTATDDTHAFVVTDGSYVSARWPGDSYLFARTFVDLLGQPRT